MEEDVTLPSASASRERLLPVQVDHRRWSSSQDAWCANDRSGTRVQHAECDDRHGPPSFLRHRSMRQGWLGPWACRFDLCNNAPAKCRVLRRCDGETREFRKEFVRPAGFEPATVSEVPASLRPPVETPSRHGAQPGLRPAPADVTRTTSSPTSGVGCGGRPCVAQASDRGHGRLGEESSRRRGA